MKSVFAILFVLVATFFLYQRVWVIPKAEEIATLKSKLSELQVRFVEHQTVAANLPKFQEEVERVCKGVTLQSPQNLATQAHQSDRIVCKTSEDDSEAEQLRFQICDLTENLKQLQGAIAQVNLLKNKIRDCRSSKSDAK